MPEWQLATAIGIALLVAMTTHLFYRRPPAALWPALPLVFGAALVFSVGDLIANQWAQNETIRWAGMIMIYTGLLVIGPGWWLFSRNFSQMYGYRRVAFRSGLGVLVTINVLLWIGLITNPWHGWFLEMQAGLRSIYGPLWYATAFLNYAALLAAIWVHARESFRLPDPVIRSQCRFLVVAAAIPLVLNMGYVFNPSPPLYDPTALGFALSCAVFLFAVQRRDLFVLERVSLPSVLNDDADAILILTMHRRLLFSNPAAEMLFGPGQLVPGASVTDLLGTTVPSFAISEATRGSSGAGFKEHRFVSSSETETWIVIEVSHVKRSRGVPAGLCLRLRDQTELRTARRKAEEPLALLEAVDLAAGEGILVKDISGDIRYVNEAFGRLWNMSSEEMIGMGHSLQVHLGTMVVEPPSETMQRMWHRSADKFDSTRRESADLSLLDGRTLEVETLPLATEKGFLGRAWRIVDVTQARRESQAMIQSQKLEGLGMLAGGIAHDFNNLLMAILGNAELVREGLPPDSPVRPLLVDLEAAASSGSDLTGQLLAYAGKTTFVSERIDLSSLVRDVTSLIAVSIPKKIETSFELTEDLPSVRGAPAELRQLMMNLVTNAAEAIGDARGKITIQTGLGEPGSMPGAKMSVAHGKARGPSVYLRVTDDGLGMDPKTLEKIFDPFFTTKVSGRGLGLAATLGILKGHEGLLRIETAPGVGSAFVVILPIEAGEAGEPAPMDPLASPRTYSGRTVLVVDDEVPVRSVLTRVLESVGFEVSTASSGETALAFLEDAESSADLVILDIGMPGLSGIDTRARLRVDHPDLPVLLSSGYPEDDVKKFQIESPSLDAFIQKPYRNAALLKMIERLLRSDKE